MNTLAMHLVGDLSALPSLEAGEPYWEAAQAHGIDLLLLDRALALGCWSADARARARDALAAAAALELARERSLRQALAVLAHEGIGALVIKGAALARTHYRAPYLRPRSDADVLIRPGDADRAADALGSIGFQRAIETRGRETTGQFHLSRAHPIADAIDVHWKLAIPRAFSETLDYDLLADGAVPLPGLEPHGRGPSSAAALAIACIHRIAHHGDSPTLIWLWDVHLLARSLTPAAAERFIALAERTGTRAVCASSLASARERFATPTAQFDPLLAGFDPESEPSSQFIGGGLSLVDVLRSDLRQVNWRTRVAMLREHLLPPVDYMRARYATWPASMLPFAYVHRALNGVPRWLRR